MQKSYQEDRLITLLLYKEKHKDKINQKRHLKALVGIELGDRLAITIKQIMELWL